MTSNDGDRKQDGWEEKAANVLNAVMVMTIGLAIGAFGVWVLWRLAAAVIGQGPGGDADWTNLVSGAGILLLSIQVVWFGAGMLGSRRR